LLFQFIVSFVAVVLHFPFLFGSDYLILRVKIGSHGLTAAALFTLTLFRRRRIIHGPRTYFEDAGQRSPVRDIATFMQYDAIAARSSHGTRPKTVAWHRALSVHPGTVPFLQTIRTEEL